MASVSEVFEIIDLLSICGLEYTPNAQKLERMTDAWVIAFADIPGDILHQAAIDYMAIEPAWPSPAKLRQVAEKVKSRNGQSIAGGQFVKLDQPRIPFKGVYRPGVSAWLPVFRSDHPQPVTSEADPEMEPPEHPEFANWVEAQAWQEEQGEPV
jgi:hypothetical protein